MRNTLSNETKKCKYCQSEIDKKAKICPNCRKNQGHPILGALGILIGLILIASVITSLGDKNTAIPTSSNNTNGQEEKKYNIGDKITTDKYEINILKVEEKSKVGTEYFQKQAGDGNTFICFQVTYKNISNKPIGMFDQPAFKLIDQNNTEYSADAGISGYYATEIGDDSKIISDLNPGVTVKETGVFEIGKDVYSNNSWNLEVITDKILKVTVK